MADRGLPDGRFSNQKFQFGYILQWKKFHYFIAIWSILQLLGIFCGPLIYVVVFWHIFPVLENCSKINLATPAPLTEEIFTQLVADQTSLDKWILMEKRNLILPRITNLNKINKKCTDPKESGLISGRFWRNVEQIFWQN
jgi:hypothetical protein